MTPEGGDEPPRCSACGRPPRADETGGAGAPWTWSVSTDEGQTSILCDGCIRTHARSIEAKLDKDWW